MSKTRLLFHKHRRMRLETVFMNCKFSLQVGGIVVTNRPDCKNGQYQSCIKQGDILLNRVQKLSRVINI